MTRDGNKTVSYKTSVYNSLLLLTGLYRPFNLTAATFQPYCRDLSTLLQSDYTIPLIALSPPTSQSHLHRKSGFANGGVRDFKQNQYVCVTCRCLLWYLNHKDKTVSNAFPLNFAFQPCKFTAFWASVEKLETPVIFSPKEPKTNSDAGASLILMG